MIKFYSTVQSTNLLLNEAEDH